ncbi:hypothetical protein P3T37_001853 [Kitasatospora sp. MAA4]|uniref:DUF4259 domain-containing protein n=1 Tax=Kitasatospora sp. MAA4 TaxID=3035093 RepID=UPI002474083D|nr:DUF4259 domain-containing protein [Kitasatospora sp. MAA4]MDH6132468.1 hypothetical protein [Kitasatospora sp. MAA4]
MGTWGSGNFDDDTAADHLSIVTDRLIAEVAEAMAGDPVRIEADEYWGVAVPCNLELLYLLNQQGYVGAELPKADVIEGWKASYLPIWERSIDELDPKPEHRTARREILVRTFDQLTTLARARHR